jgi:orotidine-5'-phosphate decarboxylase
MMRAALKGAERAGGASGAPVGARPRIIGVTVLTSLVAGTDTARRVLGLARDAAEAGLDGVVCSPHEVGEVRRTLGPGFLTVVPGIRLADDAKGDQARTGTPGQAAKDGANFLVVGRSVTGAKDPRAALAAIKAELQRAAA